MTELRIHTQIQRRYRSFDASGRLPFSIIFGLCRRSPPDTDPRPILLDIAGSLLDVPYALAHGLLTLREHDPEDVTHTNEVDLSRLNNVAAKEAEFLSLPSPVNRTERWRCAFTLYHYHVDVNSLLASILEPGKSYTIRVGSEDLGVERWAYSYQEQFIDNEGKPSPTYEAVKLVSKPAHGNARFKVVKSLSWPPEIETRICLCTSSLGSDSAITNDKLGSDIVALEVSVVNKGSNSVTVQTRGRQRFLTRWALFEPEPADDDHSLRIIHPTPYNLPISSLQVVASETGQVVRGYKHTGIRPLTVGNVDRRPGAEDLVTLKPGVPVIRNGNIRPRVNGLKDGQYKIRMEPRGCRWWHGEVAKEVGDDGRLPAHLCGAINPPLMLESQDEVELRLRDGKVVDAI